MPKQTYQFWMTIQVNFFFLTLKNRNLKSNFELVEWKVHFLKFFFF